MSRTLLLVIVALVLYSGCTGEKAEKYKCSDGSEAVDPLLCPHTKAPKPSVESRLTGCINSSGEKRDTCISLLALEYQNSSLCFEIESIGWRNTCFIKTNASDQVVKTTLTTSSTVRVTTSTSTTTSTLLCGNGVLDSGEECDVGKLCMGLDGVCYFVTDLRDKYVCLINSTCDLETQLYVGKNAHDFGQCTGCYGPNHVLSCKCIKNLQVERTTTSTTLPVGYYGCLEGACTFIAGVGNSTCIQNRDCFHFECKEGACVIVKEQGNDTCHSYAECFSIWDDV
ncbi:MAG: hypothetical protein KKD39_03795 [Candidatus Altiarchaeota archaeon]|nr:hypothetical protein [Candidatus Altiarchaeota archaeon]